MRSSAFEICKCIGVFPECLGLGSIRLECWLYEERTMSVRTMRSSRMHMVCDLSKTRNMYYTVQYHEHQPQYI